MTKPMRTLLVDDEPSARLRLSRLLGDETHVEIIGEPADGVEAVKEIERLRPDLIFLDVQMPGLDGFDVLRALPRDSPLPLVIFVTGFHEYALKAFDANAVAYLLKPVEMDRLQEMVERAWRLHSFSEGRDTHDSKVKAVLSTAGHQFEHIVARKLDRLLLLEPHEVMFFHMDNGAVRAKTAGDSFWVNYQLGELEAALSSAGFFRAHRSTLVNLKAVKEIRPDVRSTFVLVMSDSAHTQIEVSERQGRLLRERIPGL
jgi:two-component system, LytTR family, response regulator